MELLNTHIAQLQYKLQQLLKQYVQLKKENEQLKKMVDKQATELQTTQQQNHQLAQQINSLKLTKTGLDNSDKKILEKQINTYLKEIDKCMALLTQ